MNMPLSNLYWSAFLFAVFGAGAMQRSKWKATVPSVLMLIAAVTLLTWAVVSDFFPKFLPS
jgi:hypothetical protein